jgi:hypothetical protein
MTATPQELLAQRHGAYKKTLDRVLQLVEDRQQAEQRKHDRQRELAEAEAANRQALGDALLDGGKHPDRKTERARASLEKAEAELTALQDAVDHVGAVLDRMPVERKGDWLRQAQRDFEAARADCEQQIDRVAKA